MVNMKNKKALLKQLKNDLQKLETKIQNQKRYNIYAHCMQALIKSGIILEQSFPFIIATAITYNLGQYCNSTPFIIDKVEINKIIETTNTSTGIYHKTISWNEKNKNNPSFIHTTGWTKNQYGLYERTITTYKIDHSITEENIETILELSKEEVENNFEVLNIKTIQKNILDPEDELYTEEMLTITHTTEDINDKKLINEPGSRNMLHTGIMGLFILWQDTYIKRLTKNISNKIQDKLTEKEAEFKPISKDEIEKLNQIINLQKENLKLIEETNQTEQTYTKKRK